MTNIDLVDDFCVLLLEESPTLQALFDDWLEEIPVRVASTPTGVLTEFDTNVAVACLCESTLGEKAEKIRKHILSRNPYCQLVVILPRSSFLTIHEDQYDACLQRPILKDDFRQTIANRLIRGSYSALLRQFYDLNMKLLWLKRAETQEDTLADANLDRLLEQHNQLCSQLNSLQDKLSSEDIKAISRSIDLHKRYLKKPADDINQGVSSKYHPPRCPACKLPWGVDHGNELGKGLTSIGASVWQCTRCDKIVHGLGDSARRVM